MISWIKGELVDLWRINNKFFVLINCQGLGYEIQILESIFIKLKTKQISDKNLVLWLKHIKKEDSDFLFGFTIKDQKDFFIEILNIKGIGVQIGMALLNKFSIDEILIAIDTKNTELISSVQGIGQKMTERIILELKSKLSTKVRDKIEIKNNEALKSENVMNSTLNDIKITLQSLNYPKKDIKNILPLLIKESDSKNKSPEIKNTSFESLLKLAMNYLDNKNSNLDQ